MSSKEALERLSECANGEKKLLFSQCLELENIIKKDLNRLEKLEKVIDFINEAFVIELNDDEEDDTYTICLLEYDEYLEEVAISGVTKYVDKEQYDLLKEVLENE